MQISFTRSKLTMLLLVLAAIAAYLAPNLRAEQPSLPPTQVQATSGIWETNDPLAFFSTSPPSIWLSLTERRHFAADFYADEQEVLVRYTTFNLATQVSWLTACRVVPHLAADDELLCQPPLDLQMTR